MSGRIKINNFSKQKVYKQFFMEFKMAKRDYNMKDGTKKTDPNDKYLKESFRGRIKRGSGNINPYGGPNFRGGNRGSGMRGGNSYIDPKSAITEISQDVKIKGEKIEGHYNVNGLPVKGPIKINNLRIYKEGKLIDKLQLIALTSNIYGDEWFDEKKALLVDEYISNQGACLIKRGHGYVYERSFFNIE